MINRETFKHITNGNIIVVLSEAVSEKSNTPVVIFKSINQEDDGNKIRTTEDFNLTYKPYKVK
jgi:hypothetical protein